ncbi:putative Ig domain-containing protein, partial [Stieleria sp.]|uniref:putative Ig domain-containing protein n=1 Tax=Stieleria sp. TaxID=2795976 RepID=UPI003564018B
DSRVSLATLDAFAPTSTVTTTAIGGNQFEVSWTATDDAGGSGVAAYSLLVSRDGGTRYRSVLYRTDQTSYLYQADPGEQPLFLVRAIDNAGNVEPVAQGVRVPRLVPEINLGSAPSVSVIQPVVIPKAEVRPETVADRVFAEAAFGIPSRTSATQPSKFTRVIRPLAAERFVTIPGESGAGIGALAMAVGPDGAVYLSGGAGRNELYKVGQTSSSPSAGLRKLEAYATTTPIYELAFDASGQLWASTGGEGLLQLDPNTGAVLDRIGAGIALGIAAIPGQTALYVSTTGGISRFDTATRKLTPFSDIRVDSLAVAADGTLYGTAWPEGGEVLRFDFRGRAERVATVSGRAESIAFGPVGSILEGALLVGHETEGSVTVLDPLSLRQTKIATGGRGRVEGIQPISDGRFLVTRGDQVDVFFTVAAPRVIQTRIADGMNRAELVFDVALANNVSSPVGGNNPANYALKNKETGESVNIGAVRYDKATRSSQLLFETLAPAEYELTVSSTVESEQGIPIGGSGFTTTFRVFEDVSISTRLSYSNTRLNRADGTLLFDVMVSNSADFDIAGPINVVFDNLGDNSVVFFDNANQPAGANGYQVMADGTVLGANSSSQWHTVTIANPNLLDLNFNPRILATLPPNQLSIFASSPALAAAADAQYQYSAEAEDPDGATITYVLAGAPKGATVDPNTGVVDWKPGRDASPKAEFELRAYDARGAYKRQTWIVDVTGANRAPVVAPISDVFATEGDLIEVPISGFDPDGDDLFYFADNLPPGAVFDPFGQALRWRPGGNQAGVYDDVTLIVSDGFVESSVSFQVVVANNNVAPTIAPIASRTINEGDQISFTVFGDDADGDQLRYLSPNLPPGAFLDPNTGIFEWTPGFDQHGVYELTLYVDDGQVLAQTQTVLTVNNLNGPVRFPAIDPFEIFEGQSFQLRVAAFDPEFPVAPVTPSANTQDFFVDYQSFIPDLDYVVTGLPAGANYDETTQLLTWTPGFNDSGQYDITFQATDDGDGTGVPTTDTVTLSLTVADANFPPQIVEVAAQSVAVGQTLDIPISASDFEGAPLALAVTFSGATQLPDFATFTDNGDGTGLLSLAPQPGDRDDILVAVTAT